MLQALIVLSYNANYYLCFTIYINNEKYLSHFFTSLFCFMVYGQSS